MATYYAVILLRNYKPTKLDSTKTKQLNAKIWATILGTAPPPTGDTADACELSMQCECLITQNKKLAENRAMLYQEYAGNLSQCYVVVEFNY